MKLNPFKPNSIVGPGMFAGRFAELRLLDQGLFQTQHHNPWHFLIHGERGIGKSSLLSVAEFTAQGDLKTLDDGLTFKFVPVSISLEAGNSYPELIGKIGRELSRQLKGLERLKTALKSIWDFVSKWEVGGVKYAAGADKTVAQAELLESLVDTFATADSTLKDNIDGFLVLIDEADKGCKTTQLGEFVKMFTEHLSRRRCNRVCLGIAGISDVIGGLKLSHESSVRILNHMRLDPLAPEERLQVVKQGLQIANDVNDVKTTIQPDAAQLIATISEGYPHFIQQYAYSAFEIDMDNKITVEDIKIGAYSENGALDQLGARYFEGMYSDEIDSDDYRKVLKVMAADTSGEYITRKQIKTVSGLKDTTLSNALAALSKRHIIKRHRDKSGLYKLPSGSFSAWIQAKARKEQQQVLPVPPTDGTKPQPQS